MRPRADRPVNKSCEVTVPGSPGRGNGENRPSGQPAADNRSGPAVSRKPESDRLLGREIVERARRILRDGEDLVEAARAESEPLSGTLRMGVVPTIGPFFCRIFCPGCAAHIPLLGFISSRT